MAPPKELTPEQRDLWIQMDMDRAPIVGPDQTREQAIESAVASFQYACAFDGLPQPSDEVIKSGFRTG